MTTVQPRGDLRQPTGPEHPAFAAIRNAIQQWRPKPWDRAAAPNTRQLSEITGMPHSTISRHLASLTSTGHVAARTFGRGYIWQWVGDVPRIDIPEDVITPGTPGASVSNVTTGPVIRVQLAPAVDNLDGGGKLPYPFVVYPWGGIGGQKLWHGAPWAVIGFADDLARQRISVWWSDYIESRDWPSVVGKYLVTEAQDGRWSTHLTAVQEAHELARV